MKIAVIGTGFVGVVSAGVFASFGNDVVGIDIDLEKIKKLQKGQVPFYEPGLEELLLKTQSQGNLKFSSDYSKSIPEADVIIVAVGTPSNPDGSANLDYVWSASKSLAPFLKDSAVVAIKSTVPPGVFKDLQQHIDQYTNVNYALCSLPEFLREGSAIEDTIKASRVVIGSDKKWAVETLKKLHQPIKAPVVVVSPESAQLSKYAANAYLATRITFINQVANICEKIGADIQDVIQAIGHDPRIGHHYWFPGLGYGGSCFPKDVKELINFASKKEIDHQLFKAVNKINQERPLKILNHLAKKIGGWQDKKVALLGLSFKPNTDDLREAPSTIIAPILLEKKAQIKAYDPKALNQAQSFFSNLASTQQFVKQGLLTFHTKIDEACLDADVILAVVEWPEIIDFLNTYTNNNQHKTWLIDFRNQLDGENAVKRGFNYLGMGR